MLVAGDWRPVTDCAARIVTRDRPTKIAAADHPAQLLPAPRPVTAAAGRPCWRLRRAGRAPSSVMPIELTTSPGDMPAVTSAWLTICGGWRHEQPGERQGVAGARSPGDRSPARREHLTARDGQEDQAEDAERERPAEAERDTAAQLAGRRGAGAAFVDDPVAVGLEDQRDRGGDPHDDQQPADQVAAIGHHDDRAEDRAAEPGEVDERPAVESQGVHRPERAVGRRRSACRR